VKRKPLLLGVAAVCLYFVVYGLFLQFPAEQYFDEVFEAKTAQSLLTRGGYESIHPPFGHMLMAVSMLIFGERPWAWRLPSLLAGLGSLWILYALMKKLTTSPRTAFFAVFLFGLDGLSFTQARIGILNAMMLFFMLICLFCFLQYALFKQWPRGRAFCLSGIFLGLALATRWVAAGILFPLAIFFLKPLKEDEDKGALLRDSALFMGILPLVIYFGVFALMPAFNPLGWKGFDWSTILKFQSTVLQYNLQLKPNHLYNSEWWGWPFLVRPIWYYFAGESNRLLPEDVIVKGIICIGNPAIFWALPLAIGYATWGFFKEKTWLLALVTMGFFSQWLPWMFISRGKFFHYFYPVMPFAVMALAIGLEKLWQTGRVGRFIVVSYLVLVVGMFAYWYPLLNGLPIRKEYFENHIWFHSWM
jgi:dolichyl-phosphate-mannose-protein mannosyltransferase